MNAGAELMRKRMETARELGDVRRYLALRRGWLRAQLVRPRRVYGVLHPMRADRAAFDHVEQ